MPVSHIAKVTLIGVFLFMLLLTFGCSSAGKGYQIVWADEFNGDEINPASWEHQVFPGVDSGNNELQYYTARPENSFIRDGKLVIRAMEEDYKNHNYTSARLHTKGRCDFLYGRIEGRIKIPSTKGIWPAFWMMPSKSVFGGWPHSGEIDIMESVNTADEVYGSLHFAGPDGNHAHEGGGISAKEAGIDGLFSDDFHIYSIEWEPNEIRWYVDGQLYSSKTNWQSHVGPFPAPYNQEFHIILNVAVGGSWPGSPDETTVMPQEMIVDWIRVYQMDNNSPGIKILSPGDAAVLPSGESVVIKVDADDPDGNVNIVEFYSGMELLGTKSTAPYTFEWENPPDGCYKLRVKVIDDGGYTDSSEIDIIIGKGCPQMPFNGTPHSIPGKIQVEDFDKGVEGEAYHDNSVPNEGRSYRPESGVDIEDNGEGRINIGWTAAGEWLEYAINVESAGSYKITCRVASGVDGGAFHLKFDGINKTSSIKVPPTGNWDNYVDVTVPSVNLSGGPQQMRLVCETGGINIDWIDIQKSED
jgi:beta-glucanase (GH16 family)